LVVIAVGVLALKEANVMPFEMPLAWAAIIVGSIYALQNMNTLSTGILEKALHIGRIPFGAS